MTIFYTWENKIKILIINQKIFYVFIHAIHIFYFILIFFFQIVKGKKLLLKDKVIKKHPLNFLSQKLFFFKIKLIATENIKVLRKS